MKTKIFTLLFAILASTCVVYAESSNCGENLTWNLANGVLTISGTGAMDNFSSYTTRAPWYSTRTSITVVNINEGVSSIGNEAFADCPNLESISIPNSVTNIGTYVFAGCSSLKSILIPSSVTRIGEWSFRGCYSVTSVVVETGNIKYDSRNNCNAIIETATNTLVFGFKNTIIPNSVTSIGYAAFSAINSLTSISIPAGVTSIGYYAFESCFALNAVVIPSSVTSIGVKAFWNCRNLTSVENNATTPQPIDSNVFGGDNPSGADKSTCKLYVPDESIDLYRAADVWNEFESIMPIAEESHEIINPVQIGDLYYNLDITNHTAEVTSMPSGKYMGNITIPSSVEYYSEIYSVTRIGNLAFYGCGGINSIDIPNSVTSIGWAAFYFCTQLKSLMLPSSLVRIEQGAFDGCRSVKSLTIPASVTSIAWSAFSSCSGLTSIIVESENTVYDSRNNCNAIIETTSNKLIEGCKNTVIPASVTTIGDRAFWNRGIVSITIPSGVTNIEEHAFASCQELTYILNFSSVPQTIQSNVFDNVDKSICVLYVLEESIDLYRAADVWSEFENIIGVDVHGGECNINYHDKAGSIMFNEVVTLHVPEAPIINGFTFLKWQVVAGDLEDGINIQAVYEADSPDSTPDVYINPSNSAQKLVRNGNVYILTDDHIYSITGQEIK